MTLSISVITPSFNQGRFIERTIKSVLQQDLADLDYWVIDGGSTDETVAILKQYNTKLHWISEPDKGQTHAVNKGLARTTGDIICWLNSDDIYYPETIKTISDFFAANPQVDIVYGDANYINEHDQIIEPYYTKPLNIERLKKICTICQPAVFFRREVIKKFGHLDENLNYCMDYEYWLRLALNGAVFGYLRQVLAGSRLHPDTKTLGSRVKVNKETNDMLQKKFNKVPNRWLYSYAHAVITTNRRGRTSRWRFAVNVSRLTILASLHWNKTVNLVLFLTIARCLSSGIYKKWRLRKAHPILGKLV